MNKFTIKQINKFILEKQCLLPKLKTRDILYIIKNLYGLHATGAKEPYLSLFVRSKQFKKELLHQELFVKKTIAKIRGMRNTLFIVPKEDIVAISQATKSLRINRFEGFFKYTDWEKEEYDVIEKKIIKLLDNIELSTSEIKKKLSSDKSLSLIISLMCDRFLLIRGKPLKSWKDNRSKYTLFKNYFPNIDFDELSEQDAIVIVIKNYINSYGPVTENDIIWWLGLPKTKIIKILKILEDQLTTIKIGDFKLDYLISNTQLELLNNLEENEKSIINLLPLLDPYLMSYKDRRRYVSSKDYNYIYDRSGNATTVILLDGRVIGIWDYQEQPLAKIMIHLFYKVSENVFEEIEKLGSSIGKFITGQSVNIKYEDEMIPLTKRKAGRFMHPLL